MSTGSSKPDSTQSLDEIGADTLGRYRYQAAYAAYVALDMLKEDSNIDELYHEYHEDILIKLKTGDFVAYQVKTRDISFGSFKFGDDQIIKSLVRFSEFEKKFPNSCIKYVIASNCGFWKDRQNSSNIEYCISGCNRNDEKILNNTVFCRYIKKIMEEADVPRETVIEVLKKVDLLKSPPLSDLSGPLIKKIVDITGRKNERYDTLILASEELTSKMLKIGSKDYDLATNTYIIIQNEPEDVRIKEEIKGKRIKQDDLIEIIEDSLSKMSSVLYSKNPISIDSLPKGITKLELKMAKGGLSIDNIDNLKNLKYSSEVLFTGWITKYGREQANLFYQDLLIIVRNECLGAHDFTYKDNELYGTEMLLNIRKILRKRHSDEILNKYRDCMYEHLLGIVGILTEECKIWWSEQFDVEEDIYI